LSQSQQSQRTALVLGSSGSLGSSIAAHLKSNHDCIVIGSDIHPPSKDRIDSIDAFIQLPSEFGTDNDGDNNNSSITIDSLYHGLRDGLLNLYNGDDENVILDAIICANGGFAMDDDDDHFDEFDIDNHGDDHDNNHDTKPKPNKGHVHETMLQMNYYPVLAAGEIAKSYMSTKSNTSTLFVAFGAVAALTPAPNMTAYTSSKVLTHYYIQTIGSMTGNALKKEYKIQRTNEMGKKMRREGLYLDNMSALAILPIMLDTESNRQALPGEDFSRWTKGEDIAKEIGVWLDTPDLRPHSGSLVKVVTKNNESEFTLAR
jgi:dihydropteridine reductase